MSNVEQIIKDLTSKDENVAIKAATRIIENADIEAFKLLVKKSDYLFDFVKNNVSKRLKKAVNARNFQNILYFFDEYSADYDDTFAEILSKYANEDLTDTLIDLLINGTESQKTYAAKYFSYIPDTVAEEYLNSLSNSENEALVLNVAQALSAMESRGAFHNAVEKLNSDDEFEQLRMVKFLVAFGDKSAFEPIYNTMLKSAMAENIAAEIPYLISIQELLNSDYKEKGLVVLSEILSAMPEIIPLNALIDYQIYDVLNQLINSKEDSAIAVVLLEALAKFKMLNGADEYIFSEDNNTKNELKDICALLDNLSDDFVSKQKDLIVKELEKDEIRVIAALDVIKEYGLSEHAQCVAKLVNEANDTIKAYIVSTLQALGKLELLDKSSVISSVKDENIKIIIENCFNS